MPDGGEGIAFLSSIGFSITAACPIACPHCIIEAGPHKREHMSLVDAERWMRQAAAYRGGHIQSIIFTGGEPFFHRELLAELLARAESCGLVPAVITNAFWASSLAVAITTLQRLPQIKLLSVSTDAYHQRFIPLDHVQHALRAAQALGIKHNAAICFDDDSEPAYRESRRALTDVVDPTLIRTSPIIPAGRAAWRIRPDRFARTSVPPAGPCRAADFPTVFPDGRLIGCMGIVTELPPGHPLRLGHLQAQSLDHILDEAETNVALQILRVWGPGRLLAMLEEAGCGAMLPKAYLKHGSCDLCYALLSDDGLRGKVTSLTAAAEVEETAYGLLYYLNEGTMLARMNQGERGNDGNASDGKS
jgi:organic radical activating enzyme